MSSSRTCLSCGSALDAGFLGGSCAACLWSDLITAEELEHSSTSNLPQITGYELLKEIGHGGMGLVYHARQLNPSREVALKIIAPYSLRAAEARQRFFTEIETMAAIEHPVLLSLYDSGEDDSGRPWFTMPLAKGGSLADHLSEYEGQWRRTVTLIRSLCEGLHFAHERGILHRDLKPGNILFDQENRPLLADFGLAKWAGHDSGLTKSDHLLGSFVYLAPEAVEGGAKVTTTASDLYGMGAVLYELLTGQAPYEADTSSAVIAKIISHDPPAMRSIRSKIPRDLEVITRKAIARDPTKRYHSAAALADDLTNWLDGHPIRARSVGRLERSIIWCRRNPALTALSLILLASLIAFGVMQWQTNRELTAALDDAEDRVEFMTRELPDQLAPLGRLDLLDSVFQNVAQHYEENGRKDPEHLARHADFLTQWAQILRPRGQLKEALGRLRPAYQKALTATASQNPPIEAIRARVSAGWRLTEALIEDSQLDEAGSILDETERYALAHDRADLRLQILTASLFFERSFLEIYRENFDAALIATQKALGRWEPLFPKLEAIIEQAHAQKSLSYGQEIYLTLARCHEALKNKEGKNDALKTALDVSEHLLSLDPGNQLFRKHRLTILRHAANRLDRSRTHRQGLMQQAEELASALMEHDLSNASWRDLAVDTAKRLSSFAKVLNDPTGRQRWIRIAAERAIPLYQVRSTQENKLIDRFGNAEIFVGEFAESDWPFAKIHLTAKIDLLSQIYTLAPSGHKRWKLRTQIDAARELISANESSQAADEWFDVKKLLIPPAKDVE